MSLHLTPAAILYGDAQNVRDTPANPDNAVQRIPGLVAGVQLRPDVRVAYAEWAQFVFRPRYEGRVEHTEIAGQRTDAWINQWALDALYLQVNPTSVLNVSYGRQGYEWGTAEFINASNRLFHVNALQKNELYVLRGRELGRVGVFLGRQLSVVVLVELRNNGERPFGEDTFDRKGLAKLEYASESGAHRLGLVAGMGQVTVPWVGLYGSTEILDGLELHTDFAVSRGSRSWHPVVGPAGILFQRTLVDERRPEVLGVAGAKFTTLIGLELGLEYVANTAGYDRDELRLAYQSVTVASPQLIANLSALSNPGLEVLGRHYLYATLRWPSAISRWEANLGGGYLLSLTDQSGRANVYIEASLASWLVVFANGIIAHGAPSAELAALSFGSVLVGLRSTW